MFRIVVVRANEARGTKYVCNFIDADSALNFRAQRGEPAGRGVRERAAAARLDAAEDHRAGALRRQAL